ncbi:hypothetical protein TSAR_002681 [Trichomalopsis sarcophagae]|uniref:Uncharacterized protein n=1 Tax=Trichomalopsis sarcophagae TaxID=543379 RepID=A0A232EPY4_9HYME|nr:hypothetical protein TSAR_002681 [Trichomalopsis sarcophagae]
MTAYNIWVILRNIFQQRYIGPIDAVLEQGVDIQAYYAIKFGAFDKKINWVHEFQGKDKITELRNIFQQRYIGPIDAVLEQGVDIQAVQPPSPVLCNKIWGF